VHPRARKKIRAEFMVLRSKCTPQNGGVMFYWAEEGAAVNLTTVYHSEKGKE